MSRISFIALIGCILQISALSGAETSIQGVSVGYYFDQSAGTIRAIEGTPGAAYLSTPLLSDLGAGWLAPNGRSALVIRDGALVLVPDCGSPASQTVLTGLAGRGRPRSASGGLEDSYARGSLVAWSADSTGAVFYSPNRRAIQVWGGLPANPVVSPEIDLSTIGNSVLSVRLSRNAQTVAVTVNRGTAKSLYLIPQSKPPVLIGQVSDPGLMDFSSDGQSLFAVDNTRNVIVTIGLLNPAVFQTAPIVLPDQTVGALTGMLASRDGTSIYITQENVPSVCALSIMTGITAFCSAVDYSPSGIEYLSGSLYLLYSTGEPGAPMLLSGNQVYFVPAVKN